ncbi:MAG: YiiX/YebB-like N1pC/P60 family cysteine hydrolase [Bacteroidales bacterium]
MATKITHRFYGRRTVFFAALLIVFILAGFYFFYPGQKTITYYEECDTIDFCQGDLVLRRGKSFVSQLVLLSDKASEYSHIGIVSIDDDQPYVIHAVPGEAEKDMPEYIKMETIEAFLDIKKSADFAVYRPSEKYREAAAKAAQKAKTYYQQKIVFDSSFDLEDESKLYCTELIWRVYKAAGIDLIDRFDHLQAPFYKGQFIYPSNIFSNPIFNKIYPN